MLRGEQTRNKKPDIIGRNYQERGGYPIAAQQTKQVWQIRRNKSRTTNETRAANSQNKSRKSDETRAAQQIWRQIRFASITYFSYIQMDLRKSMSILRFICVFGKIVVSLRENMCL